MTDNKRCFLRLATAVLRQWQHDGEPEDFAYLDKQKPDLGTYKDFWKDLYREASDDDSTSNAKVKTYPKGDLDSHD